MTAFEKWLLSVPRPMAIDHVIDCLKSANGEMAWEFMSKYVGENWSCKPEQLQFLINGALNKLAGDL